MSPRSVAIVLHDLPLGGTERIALRLARSWATAGVAVTILCGDPRGPLAPMVPEAARFVALDPPIARGPDSRARLGRAAARWLAEHPVDALFVVGNWHWEVVPAIAAMAARPRIVAQISSPLAMVPRGRARQWLFERRMRRLLAGADALVTMDETGRRLADHILGRPIATTIPLPAIDDGAPSPRPAPDTPSIFAAGRLIRQKGFDLLIDAIAALPAVRLTIAGTGPERGALERRIARRALGDRVRLVGYVADIRPYLDDARLLVLPSRFEGYGAVIVEALAAGRPVVATRTTPAVGELLGDPVCGTAVPSADIPALACAIAARLAAPQPDPRHLSDAVAAHRIGPAAARYLDVLGG